MGGGKSGSTGTTTQNSSVSIPPEVLARYNSVNAQAADVAQTPFQSYGGQFVAPVNQTQQGGINQITGAANWIGPTYENTVNTISGAYGQAQPLYSQAGQNYNAGLAGGQQANQQALGQYGQAVGAASPYNTAAGGIYGAAGNTLGTAAGYAAAGTGAVNASPVDASAIGNYMSPYNQSVVQSTMALLGQQQKGQQNDLKTQQILGGSFGGDRSGIGSAVLSGQQNLASANVASNLYNQNYAQALGAAQQQQGVQLGAGQANRAALQTGANQFTGLGQAAAGIGQQVAGLGQQVYGQGTGQAAFTGQIGQQGYQQALGAGQAQQGLGQTEFQTGLATAQGYGQAGAQALQSQLAQGQAQIAAGTVQQQTDQAQLQAMYNQFLQQQAYPFQTTQFQANIAEGTGALSGSNTSANNYQPQPFFSDERLKENIKEIGRTKDNLKIIRFNYKGSPHTQIGLSAQDVEKKKPEAVGLHGGYKTVDYDRATRARGGFAGGGLMPAIYELGGMVSNDNAGEGFADGGSPYIDPTAMAQILAAHQAMYPGAAGRAGMGGEGPRGMQISNAPSRSLMKAELIKPQGSSDSGAHEGAKTLGDVSGAVKSGADLYGMGKDALVGSAAKGTVGAAGYAPESGGLLGSGGKFDYDKGWVGRQTAGLGAANSNTPSASPGSVTSSPLPDLTPTTPASDAGNGVAAASTADTAMLADASNDVSSDLIDSAMSLAWRGGRMKRYASGGMPYGDPGGYIPDSADDPIDPAKLAAEQKSMEAPTSLKSATSGTSGSSGMGRTIGGLAGGIAGSFFGPIGTMAGSALGSMAGSQFAKGGRAGYDDGGVIDDTQLAEAPPPASLELPPKDPVVVPMRRPEKTVVDMKRPEGLNPERPAAREAADKAAAPNPPEEIDTGGTGKYVDPRPAALNPVPAPTSAPAAAAPATAPPAGLNPQPAVEPPGFRQPGMQPPAPPPDNWARMIRQESGDQQFDHKTGQPKTSSAGAIGAAQIMPQTGPIAAKLAGVPWDPELFNRPRTGDPVKDEEAKAYSLKLGRAYYDDQLKTFGDPNVASAAYNAGPDAVAKALAKAKTTGGNYLSFLPKETQDYVPIVSGQGGPSSLNAGLAGGATGPATGGGLGDALSSAGSWITNAADKTGDWLDRHEKQIVPAMAFLGSMLSSPSRTLAGSVGSGLVGGAKALQGQQELGQGQQRIGISQQGLGITQNAQYISVLATLRQMQSARAQRGLPPDPVLDGQVQSILGKISQSGNVAPATGAMEGAAAGPAASPVKLPAGGPPAELAPVATPPAGGGAAPAPAPVSPAPAGPSPSAPATPSAGASQWGPMPSLNLAPVASQVDDNWNPMELQKRADAAAAYGDSAAAARLSEQAAAAQARMESQGTLPAKGGGTVSIPGFKERQVAEGNVADNQKTLQSETAGAQTRTTAKMQLAQIKNLLQTYESGTGSDVLAEAQGVARALGIPISATDTSDPQKFQEFVKNAYGIMLTNAAMNKDETDHLREMVSKTFASPSMQPGANRKILAETEGAMQLADKKYQDLAQDVKTAPHLPQSQWYDQWRQRPENDLNKMVETARKATPVMGDVPAKRSDLEEGTQYILRPHEAVKLFADPSRPGGTADDIKRQFGDKKTIRVIIKKDASGKLIPYPVQ